jgi:hypothetical protein
LTWRTSSQNPLATCQPLSHHQADAWDRNSRKRHRQAPSKRDFAVKLPEKAKEMEQAWRRQSNSLTELARKTLSK